MSQLGDPGVGSDENGARILDDDGRRSFLKICGVTSAGLVLGALDPFPDGILHASPKPATATTAARINATNSAPATGVIPRRMLGRTGVTISALGVGGHHLGDAPTVDEAIALVHEAVDAGIDFFDNCWEYHNGRSEDWLGRALVGLRDRVFVMTKVCTHGRSGQLGLGMLEESLRRLGTDHVDLWQVHAVSYDNDPALAYRRGGIVEALDLAKRQGKARFVGFSGHKDPAIHLRMLELGYPFDTVQMPLNPFDARFFSFERQVLPEVLRRGMAPLGMKSMTGSTTASTSAVSRGVLTAAESLRYAMSLPVATTICGMETRQILQKNLAVARNFQPLGDEEMEALRDRCAPVAADGRFELYKVSLKFDNPMTRMPHGFPLDGQQKEVKEMLDAGSALPTTVDTAIDPSTPR